MTNVIALGYTGTRHGMTPEQLHVVRERLWRPEVNHTHSGDCVGGDEEFYKLALRRGVWTEGHPPDNPRFRAFCEYDYERDPVPYLERNKDIVNASTEVIATPKEFTEQRRGSGTWAAIRYARVKRSLTIIFPDGAIDETAP
jgi:hypothetical protein